MEIFCGGDKINFCNFSHSSILTHHGGEGGQLVELKISILNAFHFSRQKSYAQPCVDSATVSTQLLWHFLTFVKLRFIAYRSRLLPLKVMCVYITALFSAFDVKGKYRPTKRCNILNKQRGRHSLFFFVCSQIIC